MSDKNIPDKMLTVEDLEIKFDLRGKTLNAVRGISLDLYKGEILALPSPLWDFWIRMEGLPAGRLCTMGLMTGSLWS